MEDFQQTILKIIQDKISSNPSYKSFKNKT